MTPYNTTKEMECRQIMQKVQDYLMKKGMKPNFSKSIDERKTDHKRFMQKVQDYTMKKGMSIIKRNDSSIEPYDFFKKNIRKYIFPDEIPKNNDDETLQFRSQ